jgi:uridylate kinase
MKEEGFKNNYKEKIVISVGGSLIVPNGGINTKFLSKFNDLVRKKLSSQTRQFFLIVGGGATARHYRDAGEEVLGHELTPDDLDWLGIHATRLNAHLLRTIFRDIAHPYILKHYEIIRKISEPVVVGAGWKPGWSTDFCAAMVCEDYNVNTIINMSNIKMVYDKDPKRFPDAKPIEKIDWGAFRKLVGDKWVPGMNAPFDPIAAKKAQALGLKVIVLDGTDLENLERCLDGKDFVGTIIAD